MELMELLLDLLGEKKALFARYEECTNLLSACAIDDIENYITQRTQLAIQIDAIDEEIRRRCEKEPRGEYLLAAISNRCAYDAVPQEECGLFLAAQEIFSIASRVRTLEPQITQRMETMRDDLMQKIKENHNTPKIARYLSGLAVRPENGSYLGQKKV